MRLPGTLTINDLPLVGPLRSGPGSQPGGPVAAAIILLLGYNKRAQLKSRFSAAPMLSRLITFEFMSSAPAEGCFPSAICTRTHVFSQFTTRRFLGMLGLLGSLGSPGSDGSVGALALPTS